MRHTAVLLCLQLLFACSHPVGNTETESKSGGFLPQGSTLSRATFSIVDVISVHDEESEGENTGLDIEEPPNRWSRREACLGLWHGDAAADGGTCVVTSRCSGSLASQEQIPTAKDAAASPPPTGSLFGMSAAHCFSRNILAGPQESGNIDERSRGFVGRPDVLSRGDISRVTTGDKGYWPAPYLRLAAGGPTARNPVEVLEIEAIITHPAFSHSESRMADSKVQMNDVALVVFSEATQARIRELSAQEKLAMLPLSPQTRSNDEIAQLSFGGRVSQMPAIDPTEDYPAIRAALSGGPALDPSRFEDRSFPYVFGAGFGRIPEEADLEPPISSSALREYPARLIGATTSQTLLLVPRSDRAQQDVACAGDSGGPVAIVTPAQRVLDRGGPDTVPWPWPYLTVEQIGVISSRTGRPTCGQGIGQAIDLRPTIPWITEELLRYERSGPYVAQTPQPPQS